MEYRITQLTAEIATGHVIEAHWTCTLVEGEHTVSRYGSVTVPHPPEPTGMVYAGLDEGVAIEAVKDILGEEFIEAMEVAMAAEMVLLQTPTTIRGLPWAPPPAPAPAPEPAP